MSVSAWIKKACVI